MKKQKKAKEKKLKIPKKFQIGDNIVKVEFLSDLYSQNQTYGECYAENNLIKIQLPNEYICKEFVEETFYHELLHFILDKLGYNDTLSSDEKFVEGVSVYLKQAINSSKF